MTIDDLAKVGIGIGIVIVIVIGFAFRQRELRSFLDCGVLANGFLRVRCDVCGKDRVVAFPAKAGQSAPLVADAAWPILPRI